MARSSPRRRVKRKSCDHDIYLNDDCLQVVFSFLPFKNAIQISFLSTRFKSCWIYNRNLDFDQFFAKRHSPIGAYMDAVDKTLDLHAGEKVDRLRIFMNPAGQSERLERWISFAVRKEVEEIDLDFSSGSSPFEISCNLLRSKYLSFLKLSLCHILPSAFNGLRSVTSLFLFRVSVSEQLTNAIFAFCGALKNLDLRHCKMYCKLKASTPRPHLKRLTLVGCSKIPAVELNAMNLSSLQICGIDTRFSLQIGAQELDDVFIIMKKQRRSLEDYLKGKLYVSPSILTINSTFLEWVVPYTAANQRRVLSLDNLKELQLLMETTSYLNPFDIVLLIYNSPCLERVFIDLGSFSFECGLHWEFHCLREFESSNWVFPCLKYVKVKGFKFQEHETQLLKVLLKYAKELETLDVVCHRNYSHEICEKGAGIREQISQLNCEAKIALHRSSRDESKVLPAHDKTCYL